MRGLGCGVPLMACAVPGSLLSRHKLSGSLEASASLETGDCLLGQCQSPEAMLTQARIVTLGWPDPALMSASCLSSVCEQVRTLTRGLHVSTNVRRVLSSKTEESGLETHLARWLTP